MLTSTNGIVLRSIKYGDTSLVTTIFTAVHGVQTYMVQGVRSAKGGRNKAAFFQPGLMLELVVYEQPNKNMQRIREYQAAYIYSSVHEHVVKNSVALFSVELLLRLLPEHAPLPALYDFAAEYFTTLDKMQVAAVANFPAYFIIQCGNMLGYELSGKYAPATPYLNLHEGGYTADPPTTAPFANDDDARTMEQLLRATDYEQLALIQMNADARMRIIDWYIQFLQQHSQHMGNIRSLAVLRAILH